jgi:hypothetical protein
MTAAIFVSVAIYSVVAVLSLAFAVLALANRYPVRSRAAIAVQHVLITIICVAAGLAVKGRPVISDVIWIARAAWGGIMLLTLWTLYWYIRASMKQEHAAQSDHEADERPLE